MADSGVKVGDGSGALAVLAVAVIIVANPYMETPHYNLTRVRGEEGGSAGGRIPASFELVEKPQPEIPAGNTAPLRKAEPAIKQATLSSPCRFSPSPHVVF